MNPQYRFFIADREVFPVYKELNIDGAKESGQKFIRRKIDGKLTFVREDYDWIEQQDMEYEYILTIKQSFDGKVWNELLKGRFFKTDGEWNPCDRIVRFSCGYCDEYEDILNNLDTEYDLIKLAPAIEPVDVLRLPALQVYKKGTNIMGFYHNHLYWESPCNPIEDGEELIGKYNFGYAGAVVVVRINFKNTYQIYNGVFCAIFMGVGEEKVLGETSYVKVTAYINGGRIYAKVYRKRDNVLMWQYDGTDNWKIMQSDVAYAPSDIPYDETYFTRLLCSNEQAYSAMPIPADDICDDNRNYRYSVLYTSDGIGYESLVVSTKLSTTPTQYGLYDQNHYYDYPGDGLYYPIAKSEWGLYSIWIKGDYNIPNGSYVKRYTLQHSYPLESVISRLLSKITDKVTFSPTIECSKFLYSENNPITGKKKFRLFITPKSNLTQGDYDKPAQICKTTLGTILNSLRDMFRCYWYIEDGKLKIEHESFFMYGLTYDKENRQVGVDLSRLLVKANGKSWDFGQNEYTYEKTDMPEKYKFGWMDKVSSMFEIENLKVKSRFVNQGQTEDVSVSNFTTDINYAMLCPNEVSQDGMIMLATTSNADGRQQPTIRIVTKNGVSFDVQNGVLAFDYLIENFYSHAFPFNRIEYEGKEIYMKETTKNKRQSVNFPLVSTFDEKKLIKLLTGYAIIEKYSLSLQSLYIRCTLSL